jgi:hypothetical protein
MLRLCAHVIGDFTLKHVPSVINGYLKLVNIFVPNSKLGLGYFACLWTTRLKKLIGFGDLVYCSPWL